MSEIAQSQFPSPGTATSPTTRRRLEAGTWFAGPAQAIADKRLRGRHWQVLSALCMYADHEGFCWPSQDTICGLTGLSRKTVGEAIKELGDFGYIKRERKQRRKSGRFPGNTYKVIRRKLLHVPP